MAYYPLTYLAAFSMYNIVEGKFKVKIWMKVLIGFVGLLAASLTLILPFAGMNIEKLKPLFKNDPFAWKEHSMVCQLQFISLHRSKLNLLRYRHF